MKQLIQIPLLVLLASTARADAFNLNGPGGSIPSAGTGGGGGPIYPTTLPLFPFVSTISVPHPVVQITNISFHNLVHTRAGDLQAVLEDPQGKRYNIFVRSGFTGTGTGNNSGFNGSPAFVTNGQTPFPGSGLVST